MEARLCDVVVGKKMHGSVDVDNGEVMMYASRNYMIHASRREAPGMAEIHTLDTDIIYVLEGTATLMTGGTAVDATMTAANEIRIDGWLNLPSRRFNQDRPAEHFYHRAIRFEEMFARLILPLKQQRSIRVEADLVEETATTSHQHIYAFQDVDVIVLEGIYLLKRGLRNHYDLALWIECSFETALVRALRRGQEGLRPDVIIHAYQRPTSRRSTSTSLSMILRLPLMHYLTTISPLADSDTNGRRER